MKIIFFGTPDYVLPVINSLNKKFKLKNKCAIEAVVTQKPKLVGRKQLLGYSPVDTWAYKRKVPVFYSSFDLNKKPLEADLGVLAAYGEIIPERVVSLFPHGILNVHPSLLPKYKGASPTQAAILNGDNLTGVTIIKLDNQLDHGRIVCQFEEEILPTDTSGQLRTRLFARSADVLSALIPAYLAGKIHLRKQDEAKAITTTQIKKEDALIPAKFLKSALAGKTPKTKWPLAFIKNCSLVPDAACLERFIRAMDPWPTAWTFVQVKGRDNLRLKILKAHLEEEKLVLDQVQLEGKEPVSWKQFAEAYPSVLSPLS